MDGEGNTHQDHIRRQVKKGSEKSDGTGGLESEDASLGSKSATKEKGGSITTIIDYPNPMDVLLGRGKPYQEYSGNIKWFAIMEQWRSRYEASARGQKWAISQEVIGQVRANGGRFLERENDVGGWVEVSDEKARLKISHGFRHQMRRQSSC